ncbi:MAG TPA: WhiB family transcriptional regulator, partial [Acidimicrobiales bacterium]
HDTNTNSPQGPGLLPRHPRGGLAGGTGAGSTVTAGLLASLAPTDQTASVAATDGWSPSAASYDVNEMIDLTERRTEDAEPVPARHRAGWWTHARCNDGRGELTDVFFTPDPRDIARARRVCVRCPALVPCLEGALERHEPCGVWGGQLFVDGTIVATKRRRGRPPKVPRLEDQLPEVPLPEHLREVPVVRIA